MGSVIREARPGDIPSMVRMAGLFIAASGTDLPFDPVYVDNSIRAHMVRPHALSLVLDVGGEARGMLCAAAARSPLAPITIADELVWWIDVECRGRAAMKMLREYEAWARRMGCVRVGMSALPNTHIAKIYERMGYAPAEVHYSKAVT